MRETRTRHKKQGEREREKEKREREREGRERAREGERERNRKIERGRERERESRGPSVSFYYISAYQFPNGPSTRLYINFHVYVQSYIQSIYLHTGVRMARPFCNLCTAAAIPHLPKEPYIPSHFIKKTLYFIKRALYSIHQRSPTFALSAPLRPSHTCQKSHIFNQKCHIFNQKCLCAIKRTLH